MQVWGEEGGGPYPETSERMRGVMGWGGGRKGGMSGRHDTRSGRDSLLQERRVCVPRGRAGLGSCRAR